VSLAIAVWVREPDNIPLLTLSIAVTVLVIYTHRCNIARMHAGTESRARRLWLFRSRAV
jgi:glycerol-3-phosphate acyltransferase PlsY